MRVYATELICSTGVLGFQTFKPMFCIYNKLRLHTEIYSSAPLVNCINCGIELPVIDVRGHQMNCCVDAEL